MRSFNPSLLSNGYGRDTFFSDKFSVHFIELQKVPPKPELRDLKYFRMMLLNAKTREELRMASIDSNSQIIEDASQTIIDLSHVGTLRALARAREKAEHDEATALLNAWNKGWNNAFERIKSLLAQGFTFDQIEAMRKDE